MANQHKNTIWDDIFVTFSKHRRRGEASININVRMATDFLGQDSAEWGVKIDLQLGGPVMVGFLELCRLLLPQFTLVYEVQDHRDCFERCLFPTAEIHG